MNTEHGSNEHQEDYSFMQETFKDERLSPKKLMLSISKWAGIGLVFGCAACIAFCAIKPWAQDLFKEEPSAVEFSQEEVQEKEPVGDGDAVQSETREELTIEDHYVLNNELKKVATEAQRSVVTISGIAEGTELNLGSQHKDGAAGLIVADNGRELLILSNYSTFQEGQIFQVSFTNGAEYPATLKQKDKVLDLAIFSVAKEGMEEAILDGIKIATFGNSERLGQGRTLIAVGEPYGFEKGIGYGVASTLHKKVSFADGEYQVLVTDMVLADNGNGFLFDVYGNVMGVIDNSLADEIGASTMTAYEIAGITPEIEKMSNGIHIPYVGIIGTIVTEEMANLYNIPTGLYIKEVEKDSPAMKAGIQNGDVIRKLGDTRVTSINSYHDALYKLQAGNSVKMEVKRYGTEAYVDMAFTIGIGIK